MAGVVRHSPCRTGIIRDVSWERMDMALKYLQIEEDLKNMILAEEIRPGDKLPSENVLAEQYSVSRQTVRKAL
jgi:GntR family transcriptional regulator of arabinose operon